MLESRFMSLEIYIDGKYAAYFASSSGWDAAAKYIERNTPHRTPLRRFAEQGETHQPQEAAAMLADLLKAQKPPADVAYTLSLLQRFLKGHHVFISDGVTAP